MSQEYPLLPDQKAKLSAFYSRLTPTLNRFFQKELNVEPAISLLSVAHGQGTISSDPQHVLFCANTETSTIGMEVSRPLISGVIDYALGSRFFFPDEVAGQWSEIDENLAAVFATSLIEIILGYCGYIVSEEKPFSAFSSSTLFLPNDVWQAVRWRVEIQDTLFSVVFYLPETFLPEGRHQLQCHSAEQVSDRILDYIEMRRASSKKFCDSNDPSSERESEMVTLHIRVGSFELKRADIEIMKPGDVLATDISAEEAFSLLVDGKLIGKAVPGQKNGKKAVIAE